MDALDGLWPKLGGDGRELVHGYVNDDLRH
jgi:hypothetical protein